ncbi:endonuclease NucS [Candidatus Bathyarchaeota archaeon]|nr:endonuclease NucS [Candidatus Bathyarchaeota archaeon]
MPDDRPIFVYEYPSLEVAAETVKAATSERRAFIVVGNCWVEYRGRASSTLKKGERIFIVKEDGSVLIHRSKGYEPVNWQPSGSIFYTSIKGNVLTVKAVRRAPRESIVINFDKVYLLTVLNLIDEGEFCLYASEEDMQKAILIQPEIVEEGLKLITYEKKVEPGFIDVYGVDKKGRMVVIEIKRKTAGKDAVLQLARYVDSVKGIVNRETRGIIVAPQLAKGAQKLLVTLGLDFKQLDPRKCAEIVRKTETRKLEDFYL